MEEKNKFKSNSKYFTICVYFIVTFLICAIIARAIFFWSATSNMLGTLISALSPFFMGILIAFLINPFVNWIRYTVLVKWCHFKNRGLSKVLAILFAYLIVLTTFIMILVYLIPELINSLNLLLAQIPQWATSTNNFINNLAEKYPDIQFNYVRDFISNADSTLQTTLSDFIKSFTSALVITGVNIIKFVFNFIVAIIISCYVIIDKKMQARSIKRLVFAFFKKETSTKVWNVVKHSLHIFSNFFDGKMIDSLIIGILCFVSMMVISLFGIKGFASSALLVSIVVCVTNMIPYFGPFLGGIPCVLLLSIYSLNSGLAFAALIIVIQQLDGNLIGPKILGDSTGMRPLSIIFAITFGGWVAGVAGMLLGVPCVAVISSLLDEAVNEKLEEKEIDLPVLQNEKVRKTANAKEDVSKKSTLLKNLFKK